MICPKCGSSHLIATMKVYETWETNKNGEFIYMGNFPGPNEYELCCVSCDHCWEKSALPLTNMIDKYTFKFIRRIWRST